ncbi:YciI family protein [Spirillospora sp. NPDC047279]|uniref:YciI family protein n=1 Tax=Spirillospora sp. NPDC047279 TaxID=3155478 RepID=UPI0033D8DB94
MRYLTVMRDSRPATPPPPELMAEIMKLGEDAAKAGVLLDQGGLAPSALGARIDVADGSLSVTDGPFAESKEMISYAVYEVRSKEEAVEWCTRFMRLHQELWPGWAGECEVLQIFGPEDFQ